MISKIFDGGKLLDWCAAAAVLLYPFHDMGTAGWITTTVNYFWPVWGMFFVGFLLKKMLVHKKINIVEGIAGVLVCVIASSHEPGSGDPVCGFYIVWHLSDLWEI